jgi:RimJ/RimL family protein N-acetyltransferase
MAALPTLPPQSPVAGVPSPATGTTTAAARRAAGARLHTTLRIRDLRPGDGDLLDALHASLSPRSQYQRYHGAMPRLTARHREQLTATDGRDHAALVALDPDGAPVAVARYIRLGHDPASADIAAEVVDDRQRQGVATELLRRLARRAAAEGVERFTATVLSDTRLPATLRFRGWSVRSFDGPTTDLDVDVWTLICAP